MIHEDIIKYHQQLSITDASLCLLLANELEAGLPGTENKIWHAHPVWFHEGNPIAGYDKLKDGVRLLFWSGQSFEENGLRAEGKFKAAEIRYRTVDEVNLSDLRRWIDKSLKIQWDYKNIVKRKGVLIRLK